LADTEQKAAVRKPGLRVRVAGVYHAEATCRCGTFVGLRLVAGVTRWACPDCNRLYTIRLTMEMKATIEDGATDG
jgi:hypothetical protein